MRLYLESTRLRFLRPEETDLPFMERLLGEVSLTNHPGELPHGDQIGVVARWILNHWNEHPFGTCLIESRADGKLIGMGGFKQVVIEGKSVADLGMMLLTEYQRGGFGFEVGEALLRHGFAVHNFERVVGTTTKNNPGALRLLEKWGFTRVGTVTYENAGQVHAGSELWELKPGKCN